MRFDRIIIVLILAVAIAAAVVWFNRLGSRTTPAPMEAVSEDGGVSLLVIGIEGLELDIVHRLVGEGKLPHFQELIQSGATGTFTNLGKATEAGVAWTSVATGMTPQNHGLGATVTRRQGVETTTGAFPDNRTAETLWTIAGSKGLSVCVVGWPATWPAEEVDGILVGPYEQYVLSRKLSNSHARGVYPPEQLEFVDGFILDPEAIQRRDLERFLVQDSRLGLEALVGQNYESLREAYGGDRSAVDLTLHGCRAVDADAAIVCLEGLNLVSQRFWHYMDPTPFERLDARPEDQEFFDGQIEALGVTIERYYGFIDGLIGELAAAAGGDATIAVVADHGYVGIEFDRQGMPKVGHHMHSDRGVWIINGPRVRAGATVDGGTIMDFAPTLLAAAGIDADIAFDGAREDAVLK